MLWAEGEASPYQKHEDLQAHKGVDGGSEVLGRHGDRGRDPNGGQREAAHECELFYACLDDAFHVLFF